MSHRTLSPTGNSTQTYDYEDVILRIVNLRELTTPSAVVDLDRLERNAAWMTNRAKELGVGLRPHVKTHKCVEGARIQTAGQTKKLTVSTLAEARAFAEAGFDDITYAVPLSPEAIPECARLTRRIYRFHVIVDHPVAVDALESYAQTHDLRFSVLLKVDCGLHRAGVDPDNPEAVKLAGRLHRSSHVDFRGILTHAGQSYSCRNRSEAANIAAQERDTMVNFAEKLRGEGLTVADISIGSTPTVTAVDRLPGISEIRPGNYLFFDAFQTAIGSCVLEDVAFSVLTTVVGAYPDAQRLVVDAGALALSKDPGPTHVDPDCGFGVVVTDPDCRPVPGLRVTSLSQEHGVLHSDGPLDPTWQPGTRLRIMPNHSCLSAACFDAYHVVRGTEIVDEWHPVRGW